MRRGFTLIELLGVIVLISLLILLTFPTIINFIKSKSDNNDSLVLELIYNAASIYVEENSTLYPKEENASYCISIEELISDGNLVSPVMLSGEDIKDTKVVKATYNNELTFELVNKSDCVINNN